MKGMNNTPWPSFPSVKDTQDTLTKKVERLCILGVCVCVCVSASGYEGGYCKAYDTNC
jgi:hypothetical protein